MGHILEWGTFGRFLIKLWPKGGVSIRHSFCARILTKRGGNIIIGFSQGFYGGGLQQLLGGPFNRGGETIKTTGWGGVKPTPRGKIEYLIQRYTAPPFGEPSFQANGGGDLFNGL